MDRFSTKTTVYNNNTLFLLGSIFANTLGMSITQMYALIYIYSETNSNFYVALEGATIFGTGMIASYFYLLFKNKQLYIQYMLRSEVVSFLALAVIASIRTVPLMYISLVITYMSYGFFKPSYETFLCRVVATQHITRVNAVSSILFYSALSCGFFFAPLCYKIIGYRGLFFVAATAHLLSGYFILGIKPEVREQSIVCDNGSVNKSYSGCENNSLQMRQSSRKYMPLFSLLILISSIAVMKAGIDALEMGIFREIYSLSDMLIGTFFVFWMLGGVIAGVVHKNIPKRIFKNVRILRVNVLILILAAFSFAYFRNKYIGLCFYSICGFSYVFADVFFNAYIYQRTAKENHSYNFGLKNVVLNSALLICLPLLGYVADVASIMIAMIIAAIFGFLLIVFEVTSLKHFIVKTVVMRGVKSETTS